MTRLLLLVFAGWISVQGAVAQAAAQTAARLQFDVVTIKPAHPDAEGEDWDSDNGTTEIKNYPVVKLIRMAYRLKSLSQIVGAPEWMKTERVDVTAKVDAAEYKRLESLPADEGMEEFSTMVRAMLAERFSLHVTMSTRTLPVLSMERVSPKALGPALKPVPLQTDGRPVGGTHSSRNGGHWEAGGESMENIASLLSARPESGGRVVVDRTKTPGFFAFKLEYAPDNGTGVSPDATLPGLQDALRQELGLRLVKMDAAVPVVVVESAQKPEFD